MQVFSNVGYILAISAMLISLIFAFVATYCLNKYLPFVFDLRKLFRGLIN